MDVARVLRIAGAFAAAWAFLYLRFSAGLFPTTEVDPMVHWALLPIAVLLGLANAAMEANGAGSVHRRDAIWGLATALASFGILHWIKIV
ncbi:MAG TPA: hypothetical protein VLF14_00065 [Candidatus Binatia bacterium]|nr:hypothetical protein [Candidatus Binatia bacterium]